jgi:hypothetical protein
MKRKVLWAGITVLMAMSAMAQYSGGEGTAGNPYKISTKEDMEALAAAVDNEAVDATTYFRLTANLEGIETVIGKDAAKPFRGHFDGDGHVLDVTINITTGNYAGVFGYANGATIKNLGVKGSVTCTNAANNAYAGGICGYLLGKGSITGCYNMAEISVSAKSSYAGGICGYSESSPVSNCYNTGGTISSSSSGYTSVSYAGGICGYSGSSSPISNCYNTGGTISSSSDSDSRFDYNSMSGGICGNSQSSPSILNCFVANVTITATGAVSAGRIVGYAYYAATPINNYAHSEMKVNGQTVSDSDNDGKGEMVMDYFRDLDWIETNLKWEVDGWYIPNGDSFPLLKADPGLRLTLSTGSVTYGDTEDITFTVSSKHDDELILYEVLPDDGTVEVMEDAKEIIIKKAGTVTITATQAATDVYAPGKAIATLTIAKAVLTVTADTPDPIIYGANPPEVYTFKYGAFVNNEDEDVLWPNKPAFQCEASNTSDAGDYEIVPVNASLTADNYTFNFVKGKLTIDKRELTVTPKPATRI